MPNYDGSNIEIINSEIQDDYSDDDLYKINSWGADLSFRELITMYKEGELSKPELQRYYIWDKTEASRFIDSLLSGLPVPSIFLANTKEQIKLIVDGYQRIMSVYDYVRGIFSTDNKIFKLSRSDKINKKWRGKAFSELTDSQQRKIQSTTIHSIIFEQLNPKKGDTGLYQVFERINTGGRILLPQEIRNCVYQGKFNDLLMKLNKKKIWRELYGLKNIDSRMRDVEFILRFFALLSPDLHSKKVKRISMKKYLNQFMDKNNSNSPEDFDKQERLFMKTMNFIYDNIGTHAFNNISTKDPGKLLNYFHPTIFDAVSVGTALALNKNVNLDSYNLQNKRIKLLQDKNFILYISEKTTNTSRIKGRISLALKYLYGLDYE
ncbi:DUF262 domain-containing protein [Candidatus Magnetomoraceae bacterium gMMP-15]